MKNTIVLLFVFSTALSTPISAAEPEQGLSLGSKTWAPITNGFVFFDGEFIPPPYTVSRVENAVYINGRFLETSASWPPMKKVSVPVSVPETDPEMPDTITETTSKYDPAYSKFISDKRRYLFAKHGKEKGIDMMVEVYRKMPNVAKAEREKDVWGGVYVRLKSGEESRIDMIPPGRREDNLTREQALSMVNSLCEIYTGGLSRNDYFMFGIPHQTGLLIDGGTLYLLADGLRTAKDEAEFLAIMKTNPLPSGISEKGFRNIYRHRDGLSKWEALLPSKNKETKAAIVAPPTEPWSPESRIMVRPKLDSTLGERTWTPVTNGLVFINGEFIPPPYVVTRKGNHLYLNGDYYVAGVRWPSSGTWAYPIPAQGLDLDIPASITKQTTLFDATLSHYLDETRNIMITVYGEEEGARHLVETYKKLPCVKEAVIDTNTLCTIFVTWMSGETYRINEFPPERWAGELSRKTVVRVVDDVGEELAEGLEQNRCFTVGTLPRRGMQEAFAKALPALAHALRTAKDEAISWRS